MNILTILIVMELELKEFIKINRAEWLYFFIGKISENLEKIDARGSILRRLFFGLI